jgi:hypothetical protein
MQSQVLRSEVLGTRPKRLKLAKDPSQTVDREMVLSNIVVTPVEGTQV